MVNAELLRSVDALSEDDRVQLAIYLQQGLGPVAAPSTVERALIERRDSELCSDPRIGLTKTEAVAAIRALRA